MSEWRLDLGDGDDTGIFGESAFPDTGLEDLEWGIFGDAVPAGGRAPEPKTEYSEQVVFADGNVSGDRFMVNELLLLVRQMFASCCFEFGDTMPTLTELIEEVVKKSNYEITRVTRTRNRRRTKMHEIFKDLYEIQNDRMTFHGTSRENADSITKKGFRGAVCQRAKFGKGIYTSSDVWEALAYAEPAEGDLLQTVLAVKLLQGPTTIGRQDMADFGTDEHGNEILTVTNPEGTIFCAAYDVQLLATYRISVRHLPGRKHTPAIHNLVRIYHPTIWNRIKGQTAPVVPPPVFLVPPAAGAGGAASATASAGVEQPTKHAVTTGKEIPSDSGFSKGDKVKLTGMPQKFTVLNGQEGKITMIVHLGRFPRFLVELDNANNDLAKKFNDTRDIILSPSLNVKEHWLICLKQYLIHIHTPTPVNQTGEGSSSVLGKRPAP